MNTMSYPFMPDMSLMNPQFQYNRIVELEKRVNILERQIHMLDKKINNSLNQYPKTLVSTKSTNSNDESSIYMV